MKFASVNGEKKEAEKGLSGTCVGCGQSMLPVCGVIRSKHWRHKVDCECDHWWENETEWHRSWKNNFPDECQEIRHKDETSGEWHIADVKTEQGHILEFQHSFLKPDERQSRNNFYGDKLTWVVDGVKRIKDRSQFDKILKEARQITQNIQLIRLPSFIDDCALLKDWSECDGPVFFDFGSNLPLWCLLPKSSKGILYVGPFPRQNFVELHNGALTRNGQNFSELMKTLNELVFAYENPHPQQKPALVARQPVMQRQMAIPRNPSQRYLYHINHSPRRRGRF